MYMSKRLHLHIWSEERLVSKQWATKQLHQNVQQKFGWHQIDGQQIGWYQNGRQQTGWHQKGGWHNGWHQSGEATQQSFAKIVGKKTVGYNLDRLENGKHIWFSAARRSPKRTSEGKVVPSPFCKKVYVPGRSFMYFTDLCWFFMYRSTPLCTLQIPVYF